MVKLRWQTFGRQCGICGGFRLTLASRSGARSGYRLWRWCIRCDEGSLSSLEGQKR